MSAGPAGEADRNDRYRCRPCRFPVPLAAGARRGIYDSALARCGRIRRTRDDDRMKQGRITRPRRADGRVQPDRRRRRPPLPAGLRRRHARTSRSPPRARARAPATSPRSATTSTAACCASCGARKASTRAASRTDARRLHRDLLRHPRRRRPPLQLLPPRLGGEPAHAARPAADADRGGERAASVGHLAGDLADGAATPATPRSRSRASAGVQVSFDTNLRLEALADRARTRGDERRDRAAPTSACRATTTSPRSPA